jgi:hypothetical protein
MHWLHRKLALPKLKAGTEWSVRMTTSDVTDIHISDRYVEIPSRTITVLEASLSPSDEENQKHITAF